MLEKREGKGNGGSLDLAGAKIVDFEFDKSSRLLKCSGA
jgi:hypothetical protein